ncbi:hypothetical protein P7B02_16120 [Caulobacter segnis]|uniref:hypothetical protein n=1 Tax=Caulobacter segnis TaxID=88688 RepID=UPI00240F9E64|nr:hypothetical protein [Caulobacter segnis]MDG2523063.1 hypothetical protein [Caulobacter segnis]
MQTIPQTPSAIVQEIRRRSSRWTVRRSLLFVLGASGIFWLSLLLMLSCTPRH